MGNVSRWWEWTAAGHARACEKPACVTCCGARVAMPHHYAGVLAVALVIKSVSGLNELLLRAVQHRATARTHQKAIGLFHLVLHVQLTLRAPYGLTHAASCAALRVSQAPVRASANAGDPVARHPMRHHDPKHTEGFMICPQLPSLMHCDMIACCPSLHAWALAAGHQLRGPRVVGICPRLLAYARVVGLTLVCYYIGSPRIWCCLFRTQQCTPHIAP